ncbi:MAG: DUF6364 family protein [Bacteroidia bacterium]|nr:DUF6364 family protein [Bacteroidia bacterium]
MDTKLTLKLSQEVIEKAKEYAKFNQVSLSKLIENYLENITSKMEQPYEITPLVRSLSGVIKENSRDDHKQEYAKYLEEKYK